MTVADSVAVIADIHGNYPALTAVLADLDRAGITRIYCLGDLVGYYCQINEVIATLRERGVTSILGNHDHALAHLGGEIPRSRSATEVLKRQLSYIEPDHLAWLSALPRHVELSHAGRSYYGVHGGLDDPMDEYIRTIEPAYLARHGFAHDVLLTGQTHVPLHVPLGAQAHANPGSVGQPRDGDPRASYLVLDGPDLVFHRVTYDVAALVARMQELGFPDYLTRRLDAGRGI
jgi:predicted phosphodiesterase